jgi:tetratricopeptide (TPR) repeat protein
MSSQKSSKRRPRLSVAMIVRDEQDVLAASLESVRAIADEIIVLDTGSADQTPTLARKLGAKVCRAGWDDDFSAARNRLLEEVTGDWILWLDAGERLTAESAVELRSFVNDQAKLDRVYLLMLELPAADPNGSAEQAARPRLMPAHPGLRFTGRVGESLLPSLERLGLQWDAAPGRILRHPRSHLEEVKTAKARRDLRLIELETLARGGTTPRLLNALGEAHANLHDQAAARQAFLQAIQTAPRGSTEMLEGYYGLLTTFEGDPNQCDEQITACLEALEVYPLDTQLLVAIGGYMQNQNRLDLAARAFALAIQHGQLNLETWHLCEITEIASVCLSIVLQLQGKHDEARGALETALERSPDSHRVRRHLTESYIRAAKEEEALAAAEGLIRQPAERDSLLGAIRGACEAARKNWTAALGRLQAAYLAGCQDPICVRWLTLTLLAGAQLEAAIPVLQQWLQWEPNNPEAQAYLRAIAAHTSQASVLVDGTESRQLRVDPAGAGQSGPAPAQMSVEDCISPNNPAPDWTG